MLIVAKKKSKRETKERKGPDPFALTQDGLDNMGEMLAGKKTVAALCECSDILDIPVCQATPAEARIVRLKAEHPDLYKRARKKIGLDDSQIVAFPNVAALKKFCDKAHPASNPDARPKAAVIPPPEPKPVDGPPDKIEFDSKLEAQFVTRNRASFDNNTLQAEMRKVNRKYGTQKPVRITTDQAQEPVDGKDERSISVKYLITHYVVYYK